MGEWITGRWYKQQLGKKCPQKKIIDGGWMLCVCVCEFGICQTNNQEKKILVLVTCLKVCIKFCLSLFHSFIWFVRIMEYSFHIWKLGFNFEKKFFLLCIHFHFFIISGNIVWINFQMDNFVSMCVGKMRWEIRDGLNHLPNDDKLFSKKWFLRFFFIPPRMNKCPEFNVCVEHTRRRKNGN